MPWSLVPCARRAILIVSRMKRLVQRTVLSPHSRPRPSRPLTTMRLSVVTRRKSESSVEMSALSEVCWIASRVSQLLLVAAADDQAERRRRRRPTTCRPRTSRRSSAACDRSAARSRCGTLTSSLAIAWVSTLPELIRSPLSKKACQRRRDVALAVVEAGPVGLAAIIADSRAGRWSRCRHEPPTVDA